VVAGTQRIDRLQAGNDMEVRVVATRRTDAPVGNWQKFALTANNDCTYYVQTYNGYYIGVAGSLMGDGSYVMQPNTTWHINQAVKWRLWVFALAPNT
jgi:hypothetical protein